MIFFPLVVFSVIITDFLKRFIYLQADFTGRRTDRNILHLLAHFCKWLQCLELSQSEACSFIWVSNVEEPKGLGHLSQLLFPGRKQGVEREVKEPG